MKFHDKLSSGAWAPVRDALNTSAAADITISSVKEARGVRKALRDACVANPWLLSLAAADPARLLRAAGIDLAGAARAEFDTETLNVRKVDRSATFEASAASPLSPTPRSGAGRIASTSAGLTPVTGSAVGRLEALGGSVIQRFSSPDDVGVPILPKTEAGRSHDEPVNYQGKTGAWDVILQLHESFLQRQYAIVFAGQAVGTLFGQSDAIPYRFTFESWLFVHMRCDISLEAVIEPPRAVIDPDGVDEAGIRYRFEATTFSRVSLNDAWNQTDVFTGVFTRLGPLMKPGRFDFAGQTQRRVWAADLENGRSEFELDDGPDNGRELMLGAALDAYFAAEMPLMPVTPTFDAVEPIVTIPNSAAFASAEQNDHNCVSLCFSEKADELIETAPFHSYILDHDRKMALGISIRRLEQEILAGFSLPMTQSGVTIETLSVSGGDGRLHVTAEGKAQLGIKFSANLEIIVRLENGELVAEVDESKLKLPWYLWVLNSLLLAPLLGGPAGGIITTAIGNVIGNAIIGQQVAALIDLAAMTNALGLDLDSDTGLVTVIAERVQITPFGIFLKGNVEIEAPDFSNAN